MSSKIEYGVALAIGGAALAAFGDILSISYSYGSIVFFALAGILITAGVYEDMKGVKK